MAIKKRKKAFYISTIVSIALLLLAITIGTRMFNKPHRNVKEEKPSITTSAIQLIDDFSTDEEKANALYLDKIIEVSGTLKNIDTANGIQILSIGEPDVASSVTCSLNPSNNIKSLKLKTGETIRVKGICTGYLLDVVIIDASILN